VVTPELSADFEALRWFPLPAEALAQLRGGSVAAPNSGPSSGPLHGALDDR
jgi:hypothetical protein